MATMPLDEIHARLNALARPDALAGTARYGLDAAHSLGVSIPDLRALAKEIGRDHALAEALWHEGTRETRILACLVDNPKLVTEEQMERWVSDFADWEVCDQCCSNLLERTPFAYDKALEWAEREEEFVKRAGFVLMARLAVSDKSAPDDRFEPFLPLIEREASDRRNFVKKAVNWALRQIGKRNTALNERALATARRIHAQPSAAARWVASDAIRELESAAVKRRLK